ATMALCLADIGLQLGMSAGVFGPLCTVGLAAFAWQRLSRPYQVRIVRAGVIRFVSVLGVSEVRTAEILRIVRYQRARDRALDHVELVHQRGSASVWTRREEICRRV